jgi:hypothetical protein
MTYIVLPYMYDNYKFNKYLNNLTLQRPEIFKIKLKVEAFSGSFPWSLWAGDINSNS